MVCGVAITQAMIGRVSALLERSGYGEHHSPSDELLARQICGAVLVEMQCQRKADQRDVSERQRLR